jgi:hypothetical protein
VWSSTRLCRRRLSRVATQSWLHSTDSRVLLSAGGSGLACRFYVNRCRGERYGADCYLGRGSTSRDPAQSSTCVERTNSVPETTDSPVPRFRANRRNEPPATVSRIRGPAESGGLSGRGRSERATNASVRCAGSRRRRCASGRPGRRRSGHSQSLTRLALMVVLRGPRAVGVGSSSSRCATPQRPTRPKIRVRLNRPGDSGVSGLTGAVHITDQRFCVCLTGISWRCEARRPASRRGADEAHGRAGGAVRPDPGRIGPAAGRRRRTGLGRATRTVGQIYAQPPPQDAAGRQRHPHPRGGHPLFSCGYDATTWTRGSPASSRPCWRRLKPKTSVTRSASSRRNTHSSRLTNPSARSSCSPQAGQAVESTRAWLVVVSSKTNLLAAEQRELLRRRQQTHAAPTRPQRAGCDTLRRTRISSQMTRLVIEIGTLAAVGKLSAI